jgi:HK97 family phage major capsid protein
MSLDTLKNEYRTLAMKAHEVVTDSDLTAAEKRERYEAMDADLKALSDRIKDAEWLDERASHLSNILGPDPAAETPAAAPQTPGSFANVVDSDVFRQQVERFKVDRRINTGPIEIKNATLTTGGLADPNVIEPARRPGVLPILFERLTVADLMPNSTTTSNTFRSVVETTATNAASTVSEGGTKPEGAFDFDIVDEPVRKIAVIQKVADEALEDLSWLQSYLNGRLSLFVRIREEQQLLTGNGTAPDLRGLLNRSGLTAAQAKGADSVAVAVHKEITKVRVASFLDPDAIVIHPNDWEAASLEVDSNGQFFGNGPFTGPYGNGQPGTGTYAGTYWGLRAVVTTAITENTILLGAFATAAEVVRRSGLVVDMTNSDQDDFIKNLMTVRAEERLALAVYRPAAFGTVTGV